MEHNFSLYTLLCLLLAKTTSLEASNQSQDSSQQLKSRPAILGEKDVLVLVPSNANLSEILPIDGNKFDLLKLSTDILFGNQEDDFELVESTINENLESTQVAGGRRASRKLSLFGSSPAGNSWFKPRTSPLYLINGTVCRFVNTIPICTTLSTTGLFSSGLLPASNRSLAIQTNRLAPQSGNLSQQQPRPAALMDEESQDLIVESVNSNSTDSIQGNNQQPQRQMTQAATVRPLNFIVSRRPINLLTFGRPMRSHASTMRMRSSKTGNLN